MKQGKTLIALLLAVCLAGCGAGQAASTSTAQSSEAQAQPQPEVTDAPVVDTVAVGDWLVEPYLEAAHLTGMVEASNEELQQGTFTHLAVQVEEGGAWRYMNALTGRIFEPVEWESPTLQATYLGVLTGQEPLPYPDQPGYEEITRKICVEEAIACGFVGGGVHYVLPYFMIDGVLSDNKASDQMGYYNPSAVDVLEKPANFVPILNTDTEHWIKDEWGNYLTIPLDEAWEGIMVFDQNGTLLSDELYETYQPYREGVAAVQLNGKWRYIDEKGQPLTDSFYEPIMFSQSQEERPVAFPYAMLYSANEGYIPVKKDGLCGVIDTQGKEVIPLQYEDITSVYGGRVWAKENGKWGVLNLAQPAALSAEQQASVMDQMQFVQLEHTKLNDPLPIERVSEEEQQMLFAANAYPTGYFTYTKAILPQPDTPRSDIWEEPARCKTKNPTLATYFGNQNLEHRIDEKIYNARPYGERLVNVKAVTRGVTDGDSTKLYIDADVLYLARGEYEDGGFRLAYGGSVPVLIDRNGEIVLTEEEYNTLHTAQAAYDAAAMRTAIAQVATAHNARPVPVSYMFAQEEGALVMTDMRPNFSADAAQPTPPVDEAQKQAATAVFRNYYISYLDAINQLDGSLTQDCTENQRVRQQERIPRFYKDHTFENTALLLDESSFRVVNENGVLTAHYNVRCENKYGLREGNAEQEQNVALQQVTAEYSEADQAWYIASSLLNNEILMSENLTEIP